MQNKINKRSQRIGLIMALTIIVAGFGAVRSSAQDIDKFNRFIQTSSANNPAIKVFTEGRDQIEQENWAGAAKRFNDFIRAYPKDKNLDAALYWLAYAQVRQDHFRDADQRLALLIKEFPRSTWVDDARVLRVEIANRLGNNQVITEELARDEEIKLIALQSLFQASPERGMEVAADLLKPGSNATKKVKETAVNMIGRYGGEKAGPMLMNLARNQSEDAAVREQAIYWIVRRPNEEGLAIIIQLYDAETNPEIKDRLLNWLARSSDGRAQTRINEIARTTDDPKVRERAIYWIARRPNDEGLAIIIQLYDAETNPEIKDRLLYWIARSEDERALAKIDQIARTSDNPEVRERAVYWIAHRNREQAGALIQLYDQEKDPKLREQILYWLARSKDEQAQAKVDQIARSEENPALRERAIYSIARREGDQVITTLIQLYDAQTSEAAKERILYSLGQRGTKPALQKMLDVAKNDSSRRLRERAIYYLGRSKDPEAIKILEQILK